MSDIDIAILSFGCYLPGLSFSILSTVSWPYALDISLVNYLFILREREREFEHELGRGRVGVVRENPKQALHWQHRA